MVREGLEEEDMMGWLEMAHLAEQIKVPAMVFSRIVAREICSSSIRDSLLVDSDDAARVNCAGGTLPWGHCWRRFGGGGGVVCGECLCSALSQKFKTQKIFIRSSSNLIASHLPLLHQSHSCIPI